MKYPFHPEVLDAALGAGVEINTPFDAAVFPVVLAFQVGTVAITEYFYSQFIVALLQQVGDVEVRR